MAVTTHTLSKKLDPPLFLLNILTLCTSQCFSVHLNPVIDGCFHTGFLSLHYIKHERALTGSGKVI
jgi:hypothetical protein